MKDSQHGIASFVLRFTPKLWEDAQSEPHLQWRGHIRHVQGDEEARFTDFAEALTFMQRHLMQVTLESLEEGGKVNQEKALNESFKLWEQFASTYSAMMFETMERTIKQSEALRTQVDEAVQKALKTWRLPAQADQARIIEALNKLLVQVGTLTEKVDNLDKTLERNRTQGKKTT